MKITLTSIFVDDPVRAHKFYTEILGFESKVFQPENQLAIIVSPEDPDGTALLLEPRGKSFAKDYQRQLYETGLPVIVVGAKELPAEIERLKKSGVIFRDDLTKPEWGIENIFEDSCGNLIMLEDLSEV